MEPYPDIYIVAIKPNGDIIPLRIINTTLINPGNGAPSFEFVENLTIGNHIFNNKSVTLSSTLLSIEQDKIGIAVKFNGGDYQLQNVNITKFQLSTTTPNAQPNTPDDVFYEPDFTEDFTNNDYNALLGNAFIARDSQYFMDVDYSTSPIVGSSLTPINFDQLIAGTATRAPIQDYYYNLRRHIIPRYLGSKSTAPSFNTFSTNLENKGFGKDIVAGNPKPFVGYYVAKGGSTPEVIGKTIINLDYIIDEEIQTQVPALNDFTYINQLELFERGTYLYLDPDKKAALQQFAGGKYKIYRSGEYATPLLYSQIGTGSNVLNTLIFDTTPITIVNQYSFNFNNIKVISIPASPTTFIPLQWIGPLTSNLGVDISFDLVSLNKTKAIFDANPAPNVANELYCYSSATVKIEVTTEDLPNQKANIQIQMVAEDSSGNIQILTQSSFNDMTDGDSHTFTLTSPNYVPNTTNFKKIYLRAKCTKFGPSQGSIIVQTSAGSWSNTQYPLSFDINPNIGSGAYWTLDGANNMLVGSQFNIFNYGLVYPQVANSGYDPNLLSFTIQIGDEIRFMADEALVFYITGFTSPNDSYDGVLHITLDKDIPNGTNLNSFLIRRWIPRAGYIYLDIDVPLGQGIVRPEYITENINKKIPQIIKELTDKGLI